MSDNSKVIKWATFANKADTATLKQHAFHSIVARDRILGIPYNIAQSLCGRIRVGEGDTLSETASIDQIDAEVINSEKCCKLCQKIQAAQLSKTSKTA